MLSNVTQLPVPLTFNDRFLHAFMDSEPPCAALGLVEQAGQTRGFVAARTNESMPLQAAESGFDFGFELLGNDRYQLIHFILGFPGLQPYDIILNPNNPLVRKVVDVMRETAQYLFFVFEEGEMTAFHQTMDRQNRDWFNRYGDVVHTASTTPEEYERALRRFKPDDGFLHGKLLDWVCREDMRFLDLRENRHEVRCALSGRKGGAG
jgi:hypothetical protein